MLVVIVLALTWGLVRAAQTVAPYADHRPDRQRWPGEAVDIEVKNVTQSDLTCRNSAC